MARQVMVDLDELDHLIDAATHGRLCLTEALAHIIAVTSHTAVCPAPGEPPLEFVARVLLQRLDSEASDRPLVTPAESDHATRQVEQDLTGALLLASQPLPRETTPDRQADLRTHRERGHYLLRNASDHGHGAS